MLMLKVNEKRTTCIKNIALNLSNGTNVHHMIDDLFIFFFNLFL